MRKLVWVTRVHLLSEHVRNQMHSSPYQAQELRWVQVLLRSTLQGITCVTAALQIWGIGLLQPVMVGMYLSCQDRQASLVAPLYSSPVSEATSFTHEPSRRRLTLPLFADAFSALPRHPVFPKASWLAMQ